MSRYTYSSLPNGNYIRLVELLAGRRDSDPQIRVRLSVHPLASHSAYETISYLWDHGGSPPTIECDGKPFRIEKDLYLCLLELRRKGQRRLLWIDAISINHANPHEKSRTGPLMPSICTEATRTICWVGATSPPSVSKLIGRLQSLWTQVAPAESVITDPDPYHADFKVTAMHLELFRTDPLLQDKQAWQELNKFLGLEYFQRLWIMQDWVGCQNLVLRCESDELSWEKFCSALEACLFYSPSRCLSAPSLLHIVISRYLRQRVHCPSGKALSFREVSLAQQNCQLNSGNDGDSVFSLHWMLGDAVSDIDYSDGPTTTFQKLAQQLGLLNLSLAERPSQALTETPSWAPDIRLTRKAFLLNHPKSTFWASPVREESCRFQRGEIMLCEGIKLDFVKTTSHYLPPRRHCDNYEVEGYNNVIFSEWFDFAKSQKKQPRHAADPDTQILLDFANTIQARGCNSIWEQNTSHYPEDVVERTRSFLRFFEEEEMEATLDIRIFYAACLPSHGRKFGITERGHFCLMPSGTERGDLVCILNGNRVPVIFRRKDYHYVNLSECYVNGCMQSETGVTSEADKYEVFEVK